MYRAASAFFALIKPYSFICLNKLHSSAEMDFTVKDFLGSFVVIIRSHVPSIFFGKELFWDMFMETFETVVEKDAIFDAFVHEGSDHVVGNPK